MRKTAALAAWALLAPFLAAAAPAPGFEAEVESLRASMRAEVPRLVPGGRQDDDAWISRAARAMADAGYAASVPQLIVAVDRSPAVQELRVIAVDPGGEWRVVGGTQVSTGKPGRREHFKTPVGVFRNTAAILGYRARGTFNENHIRGLGVRGMRVWDFGWQPTEDWRHPGSAMDIRLSMHATDPGVLEPRIGRPDSEGCIRLRAPMNAFLDRHGIIDADYEAAAVSDRRFAALLPAGRSPSPLAGRAVVVFDSSAR